MLKTVTRKFAPTLIILFTLALSVGTAFAQEAEEASSSPSGIATLVLLLGIAAIGGIFVISWGQSAPDDNE